MSEANRRSPLLSSHFVDTLRRTAATAVPGFMFVVAVVAFAALVPIQGGFHEIVLLPGAVPLRMAGAVMPVALAYVSVGLVHLYVTPIPAVLLGVGTGIAFRRSDWLGVMVGSLVSALGAGTVTFLWGCHCGAGEATPIVTKALAAF
jgi:hypothetical protein